MKTTRSIITILLVLSMIFSLVSLVACGSGGETESTTTQPSGQTDPTTDPDTDPGSQPGTDPDTGDNTTDTSKTPDTDETTQGKDPEPDPVKVSVFDGTYPKSLSEITWFDKNNVKTEYTIDSAEMLAELSYLVGTEGIKFEGTTFYLDCDIVWNEGTFTISESGEPLYNGAKISETVKEWIPIGKNDAAPANQYTESAGFNNQFYGNLDGQGHKISGLYTNDREKMAGLFTVFYGDFIKNLSIVNSYIGADSRSGSFFGGCYITKSWDASKVSVSVTFENLYSDAYIVVDLKGNSRSGGLGGMIRPLSGSAAATKGFIAEFNNCWFNGTIYSVEDGQYNGGLVGVAAYGDADGLGSKIVFNDCLVTANMYAKSGNIGLVLGNIFVGIAEFNNVVAVIKDTNINSANSSGIVSTLEGNNKSKVTVKYDNVYYVSAGGISGTSYYYHKSVAGSTGIINGTPALDKYLVLASEALSANKHFTISGSDVVLNGFGFDISKHTEGLKFTELQNGTYSVSIGSATTATTVIIPGKYNGKSVTEIAANGFKNASKLETVYIPKSVTKIGDTAFEGCKSLTNIIYSGTKNEWKNIAKADQWAKDISVLVIICTDGSLSSVEMNGVSLSEYTIVIPEKFTGSDYRVAVYLKKQLDKLYGTNLEIQTDAKDYGYEILIGATKRTTATAPATAHGYSVNFKGGDLQLQSASVYAYDALNDYIVNELFTALSSINTCKEGFTYSEDITSKLKDGQEYTTKRDGDMRIMFFNMWGNSTTNYGPRDQHQMLAAEICDAYAPDVIGFQEFNNHNRDDGWWSMDSLLEAYGYKEVVEFEYVRKWLDDKGGKHETQVISDGTRPTNNFTPIFYNPEKVTLVKADFVPYGERNEEGYHLVDKSRGYNGYYMMHNDYFSKSLTWAVFKDNATGKLFGVLSTHFWYEGSTDGNLARVENARVVNATVTSMLNQYPDIPIFVGGDFNCNLKSDPYKELTGNGKLVDVQTIATRTEDHKTYHSKQFYDKNFVAGNKNVGIDVNKNKEESDSKWMSDGYIGTWTKWYHPGGDYDDSIDHIFIYGDTSSKLDIKMFDIVASKMALIASDHCPLICDFNLK